MLTDDQLLTFWGQWSEEIYCAGFMFSDDAPTMTRFVTDFREWLKPKLRPHFPTLRNSAELAMLREYKDQDVKFLAQQ